MQQRWQQHSPLPTTWIHLQPPCPTAGASPAAGCSLTLQQPLPALARLCDILSMHKWIGCMKQGAAGAVGLELRVCQNQTGLRALQGWLHSLPLPRAWRGGWHGIQKWPPTQTGSEVVEKGAVLLGSGGWRLG